MLTPKKSLGQNFLIDKNIIKKIIKTISIKNENILEIGPGTGNLTKKILEIGPKSFFAIEKDKELFLSLKKNFYNFRRFDLINKDILKVNLEKILKKETIIFGNLPYNISTKILTNLIRFKIWPPKYKKLVLMFQKEVADRVISKFNTKNYGRLSILAHWKLNIKKVCDVKPSSFFPKPKVDSSVLYFEPKFDFFPLRNAKNLEKLTRVFFMHRRKMLKKPYNNLFEGNLKTANNLKIDLNLRPQNLDFDTYYQLTREYENLRN